MLLLSRQLLLLLLLVVYDKYGVVILLLLLGVHILAIRITLHLYLSLVIFLLLYLLLLLFGSDVHNLLFDIALFFVLAEILHLVAIVDWHAIHAFFVALFFLIVFLKSGIIIGYATSGTVDIAVVVVFTFHAIMMTTITILIVVIFGQRVATTITASVPLGLTTRRALHDDVLDFLVHQMIVAKARYGCCRASIAHGSCVRVCLHLINLF